MCSKYLDKILQKPDFILEDTKNNNTIIILKNIKEVENNIQLVIKLSSETDKKHDKNSILTL